jgi:hypothetical protein
MAVGAMQNKNNGECQQGAAYCSLHGAIFHRFHREKGYIFTRLGCAILLLCILKTSAFAKNIEITFGHITLNLYVPNSTIKIPGSPIISDVNIGFSVQFQNLNGDKSCDDVLKRFIGMHMSVKSFGNGECVFTTIFEKTLIDIRYAFLNNGGEYFILYFTFPVSNRIDCEKMVDDVIRSVKENLKSMKVDK